MSRAKTMPGRWTFVSILPWLAVGPDLWPQEPAAGVVQAPKFSEVYAATPATRAVDRGLAYLRSSQLDDGSWLSPGHGKNTGIVSLAVMAFLARGHEPSRGEHGELLDRAIAWVIQNQKEGMIVRDQSHGPMYSHGISALMLGEVVGMVNEERGGFERLSRVHRAAVNLILRAQNVPKGRHDFGGWRYKPNATDSDISVTGWQLLALRAGQDCGLQVPKENIDQAVEYIRRCADKSGGFLYRPGPDMEPNVARTGTGILALEICGAHNSEEARKGGDWLVKNPLRWQGPFFYYGAYYAAQGMYQLGGDYWKRWQPISETLLLEKQKDDGSWPVPPNDVLEEQAGPVYTTAMAILSLSVEFRYLPIYQR